MNKRSMLYLTLFVTNAVVWLIILIQEILSGDVETLTLTLHGVMAVCFSLAAVLNFIGYCSVKKNQKNKGSGNFFQK